MGFKYFQTDAISILKRKHAWEGNAMFVQYSWLIKLLFAKKSTILDNSYVQEADAFSTNFAKFSVFVHRDKFSSAKNHKFTLLSDIWEALEWKWLSKKFKIFKSTFIDS